jgi:hypothetical protein
MNLNETNRLLEMRVVDINMIFSFAFDLWTEPGWLKDHG